MAMRPAFPAMILTKPNFQLSKFNFQEEPMEVSCIEGRGGEEPNEFPSGSDHV